MLPSRRNLLAWMRPRLRAKSFDPSFSRLLVMCLLMSGLLSGRNIAPICLSVSKDGVRRLSASQFPMWKSSRMAPFSGSRFLRFS